MQRLLTIFTTFFAFETRTKGGCLFLFSAMPSSAEKKELASTEIGRHLLARLIMESGLNAVVRAELQFVMN